LKNREISVRSKAWQHSGNQAVTTKEKVAAAEAALVCKEGKIAAPSLSFFSATTIPLKTRKASTKLQSDGIQYSNALKNATKTCEK
jgi:hypothetical protein